MGGRPLSELEGVDAPTTNGAAELDTLGDASEAGIEDTDAVAELDANGSSDVGGLDDASDTVGDREGNDGISATDGLGSIETDGSKPSDAEGRGVPLAVSDCKGDGPGGVADPKIRGLSEGSESKDGDIETDEIDGSGDREPMVLGVSVGALEASMLREGRADVDSDSTSDGEGVAKMSGEELDDGSISSLPSSVGPGVTSCDIDGIIGLMEDTAVVERAGLGVGILENVGRASIEEIGVSPGSMPGSSGDPLSSGGSPFSEGITETTGSRLIEGENVPEKFGLPNGDTLGMPGSCRDGSGAWEPTAKLGLTERVEDA